jgi:lysozyme
MKCNNRGIELIKKFELCRLKAYQQKYEGVSDKITIGYGHTGKDVFLGQVITQEEADRLLIIDLKEREDQINILCDADNVILNENQFSALASFVFNLGIGALRTSTLWNNICKKKFNNAASEFERWINFQGHKMLFLLTRRQAEKKLFLEPIEIKEV